MELVLTLSWELVVPGVGYAFIVRDRDRERYRWRWLHPCFSYRLPLFRSYRRGRGEGGQSFLLRAMEVHTYMRTSVPLISRRSFASLSFELDSFF
jgi:hypothetical protein